MNQSVNRREMLRRTAVVATTTILPASAARRTSAFGQEKTSRPSGMGLVVYCRSIRNRWLKTKNPKSDLFEPLTFLKHCQQAGAGGMQVNLGSITSVQIEELRKFAGQHNLFIDAVVSAPRNEEDVPRFEAAIRVAADVGVQAARTVIMPGRRYERFATLADFHDFERRGQRMLELSVPVVQKHRVKLAVENHKDQRIDERVALFKRLDSEFVGACVDTGNSFALLDDPYETIEALAPYAFTVHLKDQSLKEYDQGFLLGDTPLGDGSFDLKRMVASLKRVKPDIRFALELITRTALKVPCLTDAYWATMPKVAAKDLAAALRFVRENSVEPVQSVNTLTLERQVALEDDNVARSLIYARDVLGL
jgi:sugar phosphate isomerase/epimerase